MINANSSNESQSIKVKAEAGKNYFFRLIGGILSVAQIDESSGRGLVLQGKRAEGMIE